MFVKVSLLWGSVFSTENELVGPNELSLSGSNLHLLHEF